MSDLATRRGAKPACLTDRVGREIVMKHKASLHLALFQVVHILLVHFCAEGYTNDRLRLPPCEQRRTVDTGQPAGLTGNGTDLRKLPAVRTAAISENIFAKDLLFH